MSAWSWTDPLKSFRALDAAVESALYEQQQRDAEFIRRLQDTTAAAAIDAEKVRAALDARRQVAEEAAWTAHVATIKTASWLPAGWR